jgi:hypothetical protein
MAPWSREVWRPAPPVVPVEIEMLNLNYAIHFTLLCLGKMFVSGKFLKRGG